MSNTDVIRHIQWGANAGTYADNVPADTLMYGEHPKVAPDRKPEVIEEDIPIRSTGTRGRSDTALAKNTIRFPNAYFELIPILASMCLKGGVVPAEQSVGEGDMLWDNSPSETATLALDHGTLELGDPTQGYAIDGMIIPKLKISGTIAQEAGVSAVSIDADYFGKENTPKAVTGAIALLPTTVMNGKLARSWLDDTYANLGNTEITGLRRYDLEFLMGHTPSMDGADDIYLQGFDEGSLKVMATLLFKRSALTEALYDNYQATEDRFLQFIFDGPQIGAGENNSVTINLDGLVTVTPFEQKDINQTFDLVTMEGKYDITSSKQLDFLTITEKAAL